MNRRRFTQSLAAVFCVPKSALIPMSSAKAALPATVSVPSNVRYWAAYMTALHGECQPHALQSVLNIPAADARHYVIQLIKDGIIKPNPLLGKSVSKLLEPGKDNIWEKVKNRLELKTRSKVDTEEEPSDDIEYQVSDSGKVCEDSLNDVSLEFKDAEIREGVVGQTERPEIASR